MEELDAQAGPGAFDEPVQRDTSENDCLEGRGPVRYRARLIDDSADWSWGGVVERVEVYTNRDSMFMAPRLGRAKTNSERETH